MSHLYLLGECKPSTCPLSEGSGRDGLSIVNIWNFREIRDQILGKFLEYFEKLQVLFFFNLQNGIMDSTYLVVAQLVD